MKQITITISDEEEKAMLGVMVDIEEWINNAIHNRARQAIIQAIDEQTDQQAKKLTVEQCLTLIQNMTIQTAADRSAILMAQIMPK